MRVRTVAFGSCLVLLLAGCGEKKAEDPATNTPVVPAKPMLTELVSEDIKVGEGPAAKPGDIVALSYEGKLADGTVFDGNLDPEANPFAFVLDQGHVIKGWDLGVVGMRVGGKRKLSIPWKLAYEERGSPPKIPSKADLYFEVTLLDIVKPEDVEKYDKKVLEEGSGPKSKDGDRITVHYVGSFVNGKEFESTRKRGSTFPFTLGRGEVVPGFDAGMMGVKAGGVYELRLAPDIGFGAAGRQPTIPPLTKLVFKIEVLKIEPGK